jgi:hypothetical protein
MAIRLFSCPACSLLFRAPPEFARCRCPNPLCEHQLQLPASGPAGTVLDPPGNTAVAVPARAVPLDRTRLLRLRVWAAEVRDRTGEHAGAPAEAATLARTLCRLIDQRGGLVAENARDAVDATIALLVGILVLEGVRWLG